MLKGYRSRVISSRTPNTTSGFWSLEEHYQNLIPAAAIIQNYWYNLHTLPNTSHSLYLQGVAIDSSYNVYVSGYGAYSSDPQVYRGYLIKLDKDGTVVWEKKLVEGSYSYVMARCALDSSENIYVVGYDSGRTESSYVLIKLNSSGTVLWSRRIGPSSSNLYGMGVFIDSQDNIYINGYGYINSVYVNPIYKYNSSGTLLNQIYLNANVANGMLGLYGIYVDSSGNIYSSGYIYNTNNSSWDYYITKLNSSFAVQWATTLIGSNTDVAYDCCADSSGNVYVCGYYYDISVSPAYYRLVTSKFNSSGTLQWQRFLTTATSSGTLGVALAIDESGSNVYVSGYSYPGTGYNWPVAKYNSSGTLQWQRTIARTSGQSEFAYGMKVKGSVLVITGYTYPSSIVSGLTVKIPTDGSLTGTYGSYTYSASSLTESAGNMSTQSRSVTATTTSYTSSAISIYSATETYVTNSKTNIV
jgi:hypothetical protein